MRIKTKEDLLSLSLENPDDFECEICNNTRQILSTIELPQYSYSLEVAQECSCMNVIRALKRINKSGLRDMIEKYTFNNYKVENKQQKLIKNKAKEFAKDTNGKWFYIGGNVGTGKSHICVAIASYLLLNRRKPTKYIMWRDLVRELNANTNTVIYDDTFYKLQNVDVLYIDDFLKTPRGEYPTNGDLNKAFEILSARYNSKESITIFSSEHTLEDVSKFDTSLSSRIIERAKGYNIAIKNLEDMRKY